MLLFLAKKELDHSHQVLYEPELLPASPELLVVGCFCIGTFYLTSKFVENFSYGL